MRETLGIVLAVGMCASASLVGSAHAQLPPPMRQQMSTSSNVTIQIRQSGFDFVTGDIIPDVWFANPPELMPSPPELGGGAVPGVGGRYRVRFTALSAFLPIDRDTLRITPLDAPPGQAKIRVRIEQPDATVHAALRASYTRENFPDLLEVVTADARGVTLEMDVSVTAGSGGLELGAIDRIDGHVGSISVSDSSGLTDLISAGLTWAQLFGIAGCGSLTSCLTRTFNDLFDISTASAVIGVRQRVQSALREMIRIAPRSASLPSPDGVDIMSSAALVGVDSDAGLLATRWDVTAAANGGRPIPGVSFAPHPRPAGVPPGPAGDVEVLVPHAFVDEVVWQAMLLGRLSWEYDATHDGIPYHAVISAAGPARSMGVQQGTPQIALEVPLRILLQSAAQTSGGSRLGGGAIPSASDIIGSVTRDLESANVLATARVVFDVEETGEELVRIRLTSATASNFTGTVNVRGRTLPISTFANAIATSYTVNIPPTWATQVLLHRYLTLANGYDANATGITVGTEHIRVPIDLVRLTPRTQFARPIPPRIGIR